MKTTNKYLFLAAVILMAGVLVCHARVFVRWNAGTQSARAMENAGGKIAYDTAVMVNGGKGQLTVFAFEKTIAETIADLSRVLDIRDFKYSGGTMAKGSLVTGETVTKLVVVNLGQNAQTIVFKLEQSASEAKISEGRPAQPMIGVAPDYPGCEPLFSARDDKTGMSMAMSSAHGGASAIWDFYDSHLTGAGWVSKAGGVKNSGIQIYQKGSSICCVCVEAGDAEGESLITVLHKPLQLK